MRAAFTCKCQCDVPQNLICHMPIMVISLSFRRLDTGCIDTGCIESMLGPTQNGAAAFGMGRELSSTSESDLSLKNQTILYGGASKQCSCIKPRLGQFVHRLKSHVSVTGQIAVSKKRQFQQEQQQTKPTATMTEQTTRHCRDIKKLRPSLQGPLLSAGETCKKGACRPQGT